MCRVKRYARPRAKLTEPHIVQLEPATAPTKGVGRESAVTQRERQNQIDGGAIDKNAGGVFSISIGADAEIVGIPPTYIFGFMNLRS